MYSVLLVCVVLVPGVVAVAAVVFNYVTAVRFHLVDVTAYPPRPHHARDNVRDNE